MAKESRMALIARLQDSIHDCLKDYITTDEPVAMLDFPNYGNVGDSAIWLGQMNYLATRHGKRPTYISEIPDHSHDMLDEAMPSGTILITGGGSFGDLWPGHQELRESVLERWPGRLVVQLPQSIHYESLENADRMARAIARHGNFVLLVRDEKSKLFADRHFDCPVRLCPDMAFAMGALDPAAAPVFPVLAMLRGDKERASMHDLSAYPELPVEDWIDEPRRALRAAKLLGAVRTASLNPERIRQGKLQAAARARLRRGIRQISRGEAIVTDRLHVHICSLLIGRPHAVLDNSYGKVHNFMEAFSGATDLSFRTASLSDGIAWAQRAAEGAGRKAVA